MGISGGMTRLKGNSPKVNSKDPNRPRQIKQYGAPSASLGSVGVIGAVSMNNNQSLGNQGYGIRNIQSSKGMNRP
jgi:hypothetical protein